jgi:hypothetical protein
MNIDNGKDEEKDKNEFQMEPSSSIALTQQYIQVILVVQYFFLLQWHFLSHYIWYHRQGNKT